MVSLALSLLLLGCPRLDVLRRTLRVLQEELRQDIRKEVEVITQLLHSDSARSQSGPRISRHRFSDSIGGSLAHQHRAEKPAAQGLSVTTGVVHSAPSLGSGSCGHSGGWLLTNGSLPVPRPGHCCCASRLQAHHSLNADDLAVCLGDLHRLVLVTLDGLDHGLDVGNCDLLFCGEAHDLTVPQDGRDGREGTVPKETQNLLFATFLAPLAAMRFRAVSW